MEKSFQVEFEWAMDLPKDVKDALAEQVKSLIRELLECCLLSKRYKVERKLELNLIICLPVNTDSKVWDDLELCGYIPPDIHIVFEPTGKFNISLYEPLENQDLAYIHIKPLATGTLKEEELGGEMLEFIKKLTAEDFE